MLLKHSLLRFMSLTHYKAPAAPLHVVVSDVKPIVGILNSFSRVHLGLSLLPLYADHAARHVWEGELATLFNLLFLSICVIIIELL